MRFSKLWQLLALVTLTFVPLSLFSIGTVKFETVNSSALGTTKNVGIYLPEGYFTCNKMYPVVYYLHDRGEDHTVVNSLAAVLDVLISAGKIVPMIVAVPEGGDNFFVNSSLNGNYADYIVNDVVTHVESTCRTRNGKQFRGLVGHGMGGFGAMHLAVTNDDVFSAVASHAGFLTDDVSELGPLMVAEMQAASATVFDATHGVVSANIFAMADALSSNGDLPFDIAGTVVSSVMNAWRNNLPGDLVEAQTPDLNVIFLACGINDATGAYVMNVAFSQLLTALNIDHEFISYDGTHSSKLNKAQETMFNVMSTHFVHDLSVVNNRVRMVGSGEIVLQEGASMLIDSGRFFSVETAAPAINNTSFVFRLKDNGILQVGNDSTPGGVLQIGNHTDQENASIDVSFVLEGSGARMHVSRGGFLGLGVGCESFAGLVPNQWALGSLYNVGSLSFDVKEGTIDHNQIASGGDQQASLFAIGSCDDFTFSFDANNAAILGGGNLVRVKDAKAIHPHVSGTVGVVAPVGVRAEMLTVAQNLTDPLFNEPVFSVASTNQLKAGVVSSKSLLQDANKTALSANASCDQFFAYLNFNEYVNQASKRACASQMRLGEKQVVYVDNGKIVRQPPVLQSSNDPAVIAKNLAIDSATQKGSVGILLDNSNPRQLVDVYPLG